MLWQKCWTIFGRRSQHIQIEECLSRLNINVAVIATAHTVLSEKCWIAEKQKYASFKSFIMNLYHEIFIKNFTKKTAIVKLKNSRYGFSKH